MCHSSRLAQKKIASYAVMGKSSEKWLEEATKMDGQINGGHVQ